MAGMQFFLLKCVETHETMYSYDQLKNRQIFDEKRDTYFRCQGGANHGTIWAVRTRRAYHQACVGGEKFAKDM